MTDDITIDVPTADEWPAFADAMAVGFNEFFDEDVSAAERHTFEPERCLTARRDGEIVGTAGIYTRRLTVPGAVIPAGHVTYVTVHPTARRQGILTRLMARQFDDMAAAGEPVAILWASEGRIYQRFGYGLASRLARFEIASRELSLTVTPGDGRLRMGTPEKLRDTLVKIYDQLWTDRVGWSERAERHWDQRLSDPKEWRDGASPLQIVVHEGADGPDGYVLYRVKSDWEQSGSRDQIRVMEIMAETPKARTALWRYLLTMDLTRSVVHRGGLDDPVQFMVDEPRKLRASMGDALWLRILDLPAALAARRYASDVDVVFDVTDARRPANAGRWRLTGSPTGARCVRTDDAPDLACDIKVLGSIYLAGTPLSAYAESGQVHELTPGALVAASTAFGWYRSPAQVEGF